MRPTLWKIRFEETLMFVFPIVRASPILRSNWICCPTLNQPNTSTGKLCTSIQVFIASAIPVATLPDQHHY